MTALRLPALPSASGAYRWFYTDVQAGPWTVVAIFMIGSVFSARYAARSRRDARPREHSAVNLAIYRDGRRHAWVLSEYAAATLEDAGTLRIGESSLASTKDGGIGIDIRERTAPWGRRVRAELALVPLGPGGEEIALDAAGRHRWQAIAPRAAARVTLPDEGVALSGFGYHDTNHGDERLGDALPGWSWSRIHGLDQTLVRFRLPARGVDVEAEADAERVVIRRGGGGREPLRRSGWGLGLPRTIGAGCIRLPVTSVLESSPFYARLEAGAGGLRALGEVTDFRRFSSPLVRWMAHFRTRVERSA